MHTLFFLLSLVCLSLSSLSPSLLGQVIRVMIRDSLCSVAQYQSLNWLTARYLHNRIKSALTVCQLSWGIQFVMICQQYRGHHNIQMVRLQDALKGGVGCCVPPTPPPPALSLTLFLSHKSNLLNSCLHSAIILRLFFTVAAQWWICKRLLSFYFL